jgi:polynucleotide 5'-kinase involved in rRNA processing
MITVDPTKLAKLNAEKRIAELKQFLRDTDYVALADYDQDKPEVKAQRQAWREEVRQLEAL